MRRPDVRKRSRAGLARWLVPAVLVWSSPAHVAAQTPIPPPSPRGHVVVLRPPDADENELTRTALARVTGELTAARFQVTVAPLDTTRDPTPQVETVAPELQPVAAFAITTQGTATGGEDSVAIWVCDRLGRRTTIQRRQMRNGQSTVSKDAEVLALEAIELIRVSIAGLWPAHSSAPGIESFSGAPRRQTPELSVGLGVAVLQDDAVGGSEWMGALTSVVNWPRGFLLRAQLRGLGPGVTATGTYGSAELRRRAATLGVGWMFWSAERVQSMVILGLGVEHLAVDGSAEDVERAHSLRAWSGLATAGVGARARIGSVFSLAVELDGVFAFPPSAVRIGDTETKRLSRPGLLISGGLQARF